MCAVAAQYQLLNDFTAAATLAAFCSRELTVHVRDVFNWHQSCREVGHSSSKCYLRVHKRVMSRHRNLKHRPEYRPLPLFSADMIGFACDIGQNMLFLSIGILVIISSHVHDIKFFIITWFRRVFVHASIS